MSTLHGELLQLLKEIDAICRKYDITYYGAGGTTIGAVRHRGFIPWDDDADLYMTRDNFNRFVEAVEKEAPKDRVLAGLHNNPHYPGTISRYINTATTIVAKYHTLNTCEAGILIDIFILDPVPNDRESQLDHMGKLNIYADLIMPYYGYSQRADDKYLKMYVEYKKRAEKEGREKVVKELEQELFTHEEKDCDYYVLRWGSLIHLFEKSMFGEPVRFPFEDMEMPLPQRWYDYLVQLYGPQWMYVPPHIAEEKHAFIVDAEHKYTNYLVDSDRFIDKESAYNTYIKRKEQLIQREIYERPLRNRLVPNIGNYVLLTQRKHNERDKIDPRQLFEEKRFPEIIRAYNPYLTYQFSLHFVGAMRHGHIYRKSHPVFIPLPDGELKYLIYALLVQDDLKKASMLVDLRTASGPPTDVIREIAGLTRQLLAVHKAYYSGEYARAIQLLGEFSAQDIDTIPVLFKIRAGAQIHTGEYEEAREELDRRIAQFPHDGELLKLRGDLAYETGSLDEARTYYEQALPHLKNGLYMQEIHDRFDIEVDYDVPERVPELTELQQKQLDLLSEIDKLCTKYKIRYFIYGATLNHGYYHGTFKDEYAVNSIVMRPEDAMRFIRLMEKHPIPGRSIDYPLNNPSHDNHTIYYSDDKTFRFNWGKVEATKDLCVHITIHILKRRDWNRIRWVWVRGFDAIQSAYYKFRENKYRYSEKWLYRLSVPLMFVLGKKRIASIVFKGYINAAKGRSGKKYYLSKRNLKRSVGKEFKPEYFENYDLVEIYGRSFHAPSPAKDFIYDVFGKYDEDSLRDPEDLPPLMRIADCSMSYSEFVEGMDLSILSEKKLWDEYRKGEVCTKEIRKLNKKINRYWEILLRGEDRFKLWLKYEPQKEQILALAEKKEYKKLKKILKEYDKKVRYYLSEDLGLCIDEDILNAYVEMLRNAGDDMIADKLLKKVPAEHREKIVVLD